MIRLGLCCKFQAEPIAFRRTTAAALQRLPRAAALQKLDQICLDNAAALDAALHYCTRHGIGGFRVNSQILPLKTHPQAGYAVEDLPNGTKIVQRFKACGAFAAQHDVRLSFHPDQFIVLSSENAEITRRSLADLAYHAEVAAWIGADVINIHGGGGYGDKAGALARVSRNLGRLPPAVKSRLTLENDERVYTPAELLPLCRAHGVPLVYDVHHHRCKPDGMSVEQATEAALATWDREPLFHVSSPIQGWDGPKPSLHHDYIDPADFPECWNGLEATVEVEAKAKEMAVLRLARDLRRQGRTLKTRPCADTDKQ